MKIGIDDSKLYKFFLYPARITWGKSRMSPKSLWDWIMYMFAGWWDGMSNSFEEA